VVDLVPVITFLGGGVAGYLVIKRKLHAIRELVVALDDALQDDKITEEECVRIWIAIKELVGA
jgi:hypothetical protein